MWEAIRHVMEYNNLTKDMVMNTDDWNETHLIELSCSSVAEINLLYTLHKIQIEHGVPKTKPSSFPY